MTGPTPHPRAVSTTDHAGPRVVGCSGKTLRRKFRTDPETVPYVYQIGDRYFVSTPKLHAAIHGSDAGPWVDCQGCWALGSDEPGFDELHSQQIHVEGQTDGITLEAITAALGDGRARRL